MKDFYNSMQQGFAWHVPETFNIAHVCSQRWAQAAHTSQALAIIEHHADNSQATLPPRSYTYQQLQQAADALSHVLHNSGVQPGDCVAIVLPQRFETAVAYMAVLQMGAVAMPLSMLFGPEALAYRLQDSEAVVAIVDEATVENVCAVRAQCPSLKHLVGIDSAAQHTDIDYAQSVAAQRKKFVALETHANDPAVLI